MAADIRTRVERFEIGFWVALILAVLAAVMGVTDLLDKGLAMLVVAICAVRL